MINQLYDMPLRMGYWLLLPFILIYYILTTKQPKTTFLLTWCGMQITIDPDMMDTGTEEYRELQKQLKTYMQRSKK